MLFLKSYLLAVVIVLGYLIYADGSTCVYETCRCQYRTATCRNLSSIPPLAVGSGKFNITHLMFYAGTITSVGNNSLPPNLTDIQFSKNPITNVSRNAFQASSETLNDLAFTSARFIKLPDALLDLQNLTSLEVYDTPVTDWNIPVLENLNKSLASISVDSLTEWPSWVSNLTSLKSISISNSNINTIPHNAFNNIKNSLSTLDVVNVSLRSIPKSMSQLNLTSLSLRHNQLSDVAGVAKAEQMDFSYNNISDSDKLVAALKPIGARIEFLYLDFNQLTVIPAVENVDIVRIMLTKNQISDHTKGSLPSSLIYLGLNRNRLTLVPNIVTSLPNIQTLDLESNLITNISTSLVHQNLKFLYLQDNKISQLLSSDFPVGSALLYLNVNGNPIVKISLDAFKNLQNLTTIILDNTNLTGVPLFLTPLVNLESLSMKNIPGLTCACPRDESLVKLFSSDTLKYVSGNCSSGVNIKDFYSEKGATRCGVVPLVSSLRCISFCFLMLLLLYVFSI
ncbi:hypothetical protein BsWGS_06139 [Bradybaena similaris]